MMVHGRAVYQEDMERAVTWTAIRDSSGKRVDATVSTRQGYQVGGTVCVYVLTWKPMMGRCHGKTGVMGEGGSALTHAIPGNALQLESQLEK